MNAPDDHQVVVVHLDVAPGFAGELSIAGRDVARFQRAAKCANQSTGGGRNDIVDGSRVRFSAGHIFVVLLGNLGVHSELNRLFFVRQVCPAYVFAAALMTAIGATTISTQESQATGAIFFILHVIPLYLAWLIIETPNALLPTIFTFLPFTALLTVVLRNVFASVPLWQVAAAFAFQIVYAIVALWLAGRAFRLGMLQYGQRLNWRYLLKARPS